MVAQTFQQTFDDVSFLAEIYFLEFFDLGFQLVMNVHLISQSTVRSIESFFHKKFEILVLKTIIYLLLYFFLKLVIGFLVQPLFAVQYILQIDILDSLQQLVLNVGIKHSISNQISLFDNLFVNDVLIIPVIKTIACFGLLNHHDELIIDIIHFAIHQIFLHQFDKWNLRF